MRVNPRRRVEFSETFAVHAALRNALEHKLFSGEPRAQQAAAELVKSLESDRSAYGRQLRMLKSMESGATLEGLARQLRCSRRTVFRYLVELKAAGIGITLKGHTYHVPQGMLRLVGR